MVEDGRAPLRDSGPLRYSDPCPHMCIYTKYIHLYIIKEDSGTTDEIYGLCLRSFLLCSFNKPCSPKWSNYQLAMHLGLQSCLFCVYCSFLLDLRSAPPMSCATLLWVGQNQGSGRKSFNFFLPFFLALHLYPTIYWSTS